LAIWIALDVNRMGLDISQRPRRIQIVARRR
jgi:hypothetical protein